MTEDSRRVEELEAEMSQLMEDVERYRSAAEDALQQLDWCIGYLAGCQKGRVAKVLSANRAHIRREYLRRDGQASPTKAVSQSA
jgi:hypothetical protein